MNATDGFTDIANETMHIISFDEERFAEEIEEDRWSYTNDCHYTVTTGTYVDYTSDIIYRFVLSIDEDFIQYFGEPNEDSIREATIEITNACSLPDEFEANMTVHDSYELRDTKIRKIRKIKDNLYLIEAYQQITVQGDE